MRETPMKNTQRQKSYEKSSRKCNEKSSDGTPIKLWITQSREIFAREDIGKKVLECDSTSCGRNFDEK